MAKKDFSQALGAMVNDTPKQAQPLKGGEPVASNVESGKVQINAVIDADIKAKLGVIAAQKGMKKKELINYILAEYVNNYYNV